MVENWETRLIASDHLSGRMANRTLQMVRPICRRLLAHEGFAD